MFVRVTIRDSLSGVSGWSSVGKLTVSTDVELRLPGGSDSSNLFVLQFKGKNGNTYALTISGGGLWLWNSTQSRDEWFVTKD